MSWLQKFSEWNSSRQEQHRSEMETMGLCPDCNGTGLYSEGDGQND